MNPVLTINAHNSGNSIENNMLSPIGAGAEGSSNALFDGEFSELLKDFVSSDGKLKPLDLAALKDLNIQQLSELQELAKHDLASDSPELKQLSILSLLANTPETQIENAELFGNPEINALLNSSLTNSGMADEGLSITKDTTKPEVLTTKAISPDVLKQSMLSKDSDLSKVLDDVNLAQIVKDTNKTDIDFASELLSQSGRQESNTTKLVDQLASIDKSINPINQSNAPSNSLALKSYSGLEQTGQVMNRVDVPVNQPGWGEAVGNRLMMMVNGKMQSANIHLNPAELGPIDIRVSVNNDHTTVHFVSHNAVVRDAIEDAFPRLREMFSQNGLNLADANVSQQSSQQFSQQSGESNTQQNDSLILSNIELSEGSETQSINENMIDIGLINQYV